MLKTLTFATRRSALALAQSRAFGRSLVAAHPGLALEELLVVTDGDRIQDRPLQEVGGKGLFIKELEVALLDGRADFAVHSIKDVPAELPAGLVIDCIPEREDPRDALISREGFSLRDLPSGARVGTSSLRRSVSLRLARPDLTIVPMRGNVDTRLAKLMAGEFDAIVLAYAGLRRLGLEGQVTELLSAEVSLPAVGQGALGIECRASDAAMLEKLAILTHPETRLCVSAERAVMAAVDGSCKTPVAAYAVREGEQLRLRAMLADPDGQNPRFGERRVSFPSDIAECERVGQDLGAELRG